MGYCLSTLQSEEGEDSNKSGHQYHVALFFSFLVYNEGESGCTKNLSPLPQPFLLTHEEVLWIVVLR